MIKRITDERLQKKNLDNIRFAFIIQTIGIGLILIYEWMTKGINVMKENPLWFLLILTATIYLYMSMRISVEHESSEKNHKKSLIISLLILIVVTILSGFFVSSASGSSYQQGIIFSGIVFIAGLAPIVYLYYLRKHN